MSNAIAQLAPAAGRLKAPVRFAPIQIIASAITGTTAIPATARAAAIRIIVTLPAATIFAAARPAPQIAS